jgi:signal transduction histidine kinase
MSALLDLLDATALDGEQRAHVAALREALGGMRRLSDDALELARLGAGAAPAVRAGECAPRALLDGVARTLGALAAACGLALDVVVADDAPPLVRTDAGEARAALLDLATNALRVTRRGGVTLRARGDGEGAVAFDVADTGPGLTDAQRARLFRAWERPGDEGVGDDARLPPGGLGLVLARARAERLGGRLEVASVHTAGSTFTLVLPLAPPSAPRG